MEPAQWWQPIDVAVGSSWSRDIGRSHLVIEHDAYEWRASAQRLGTDIDPHSLRIATASSSNTLRLHPRLVDRPVVARLEVPVYIAPQDRATIYVGSPVWAELELDPPNGKRVGEIRLSNPPKTWFGANTRRGELCYASRTSGRLRRDAVQHHGNRAITEVEVHNTSTEMLVFERVRIPVPRLALYVADDGTLWTNRVIMSHSGADESATAEVEEGPPSRLEVGALEELAEPRETSPANLLARAVGALL